MLPGLRLDRAGIALLGAAAMVVSGAVTMADAYRATDFDRIFLGRLIPNDLRAGPGGLILEVRIVASSAAKNTSRSARSLSSASAKSSRPAFDTAALHVIACLN
jgi:hypothetical protein